MKSKITRKKRLTKKTRLAKKHIRVKRTPKVKTLKAKKMSIKDLKYFKKILLRYKEDITDQIKHISDNTLNKSQREAAGDISGYTLHMADVATDTYDREFSLDLAANERELLYEIDNALKRIEDKEFGSCERCFKLVNKSRLKALPYTRMCLNCQRSLENVK